jgi:hypothetical protein
VADGERGNRPVPYALDLYPARRRHATADGEWAEVVRLGVRRPFAKSFWSKSRAGHGLLAVGHLASQFCIVYMSSVLVHLQHGRFELTQPTCIAKGPGAIRTPSPFGSFGAIAAMAPARWCGSLLSSVRQRFQYRKDRTHSFASLVIDAGEGRVRFRVLMIGRSTAGIVAVHRSIVTRRFGNGDLLVTANDLFHVLQ